MAKGMQIGAFAKQAGLTPKTVRFYESLGLLTEPERSDAGYRLYTAADLERLRFIQGAKSLGLTLKEVKDIVATWASGERPCSHVGSLLDDKLAELDRRIQELTAFRDELRAYKAKVEALTPDPAVPCMHIEGVVSGAWTGSTPEPEGRHAGRKGPTGGKGKASAGR